MEQNVIPPAMPPIPSESSTAHQISPDIPPLPSGWLWLRIPIRPWILTALIIGAFSCIVSISYIFSTTYPIEHDNLISATLIGAIFLGPLVAAIYFLFWGVPRIALQIIYRLKFHADLPGKPYLMEFIPIFLLILFFIGYTIYENTDRPTKSLQRYVMNGQPLPSSVRDIHYYYWHSPFAGTRMGWEFKIDPADLPKILQTDKFVCETIDGERDLDEIFRFNGLPDSAKPASDPMVHLYHLAEDSPDKDSPIFEHLPLMTNKTNSRVIIMREHIR